MSDKITAHSGIAVYGTFNGYNIFYSHNIDKETENIFKDIRDFFSFSLGEDFYCIDFVNNNKIYTVYKIVNDNNKQTGFFAVSVVVREEYTIENNIFELLNESANKFIRNNTFKNNIVSIKLEEELYLEEFQKIEPKENNEEFSYEKGIKVLRTDNIQNVFKYVSLLEKSDFSTLFIISEKYTDIISNTNYHSYQNFEELKKENIMQKENITNDENSDTDNNEGNTKNNTKKIVIFSVIIIALISVILFFFVLRPSNRTENTKLLYEFYNENFDKKFNAVAKSIKKKSNLKTIYSKYSGFSVFSNYVKEDKLGNLINEYNKLSGVKQLNIKKISQKKFMEFYYTDTVGYNSKRNNIDRKYKHKVDIFSKSVFKYTESTRFDININKKYVDIFENCNLHDETTKLKITYLQRKKEITKDTIINVYKRIKYYDSITTNIIIKAKKYLKFNGAPNKKQQEEIILLRIYLKNVRGSAYGASKRITDANPYHFRKTQMDLIFNLGMKLYKQFYVYNINSLGMYNYKYEFDFEFKNNKNIKILDFDKE